MSRLLKPDAPKVSFKGADTKMPMTLPVVIGHLKTCQKIAAEIAEDLGKSFLHSLEQAIGHEIFKAVSNQQAMDLGTIQKRIKENQDEFIQYFSGYVSEGFVKFRKRELNTVHGMPDNAEEKLALVSNEELDETIAIASIASRIDNFYAEPIWALNQRFSLLNSGEKITEASNPVSSVQYCESLRKALKLFKLPANLKSTAYRVFDGHLFEISDDLFNELNEYFKRKGILANLQFNNTYAPPVTSSERVASAPQQTISSEGLTASEYEVNLVHAIRNLQAHLHLADKRLSGKPVGAVSQSKQPTLEHDELVAALTTIQQTSVRRNIAEGELGQALPEAADGVMPPADISLIVDKLYNMLKQSSTGSEIKSDDIQTIDLVGRLFKYMLSDENLPDKVKALLSYLHTPFLKIAFVDPGFFEDTEHPARVLLNTLADAGAKWVGSDEEAHKDVYDKIKDTVDRVVREFDSDVRLITAMQLEFSSYLRNMNRRRELMEKRATEKAQGEDKLREVKIKVNNEVKSRTKSRDLPSAVLLFLFQPWSDYLSFTLLRFGDRSDKWVKSLALVDDLIWSISPKDSRVDKARQTELHDELLQTVRSGMSTIGYDQGKSDQLADAISSLIKLAIQSKAAEPAPQQMRSKIERVAAQKAGDLASDPEVCTPEEEKVIENLKMIEFGTWFEFDDGKRLKVAWYNGRTSHYMFVDQMGKKADTLSGLVLARRMLAGKARIISGSSKPFFERALETILQQLNEEQGAKADGAQAS